MSNRASAQLGAAIASALIFLRVIVGFHHHSGENNYHGKIDGYGGDYEAQRHWMELTLHLPLGEWYTYDLSYWGLDYPPLTAYVSYICGYLSHVLAGPESVALFTSRGNEDYKAFMRATVLVLDVFVYFSAVWVISKRLAMSEDMQGRLWIFGLALSTPAIILIDHGHFQYNTVALGLALWSFHFMTLPDEKGSFTNCVVGSVLFCLSLNFKQMALYYAFAVFAYLLGRCFSAKTDTFQTFLARFVTLGVTVILSFLVLWLPFVIFRSAGDSASDSILQIISRIFPFQRGLYEGKVANIWCALSIKPFSFRERVSEAMQPLCALLLTLGLCMPTCVALFNTGKKVPLISTERGTSSNSMENGDHLRALLWGAAGTSMSFFLASFQVHEKSILLPLSPLSVLVLDAPLLSFWFSLISTWSLWPLLVTDRLQAAYVCCIAIFCLLCLLYERPFVSIAESARSNIFLPSVRNVHESIWPCLVVYLSCIGMVGLHIVEMCVVTPANLPDLFPVLWSISGAGMFCISWLCMFWQLRALPLCQEMGCTKSKML